jgi:hypothetical protein
MVDVDAAPEAKVLPASGDSRVKQIFAISPGDPGQGRTFFVNFVYFAHADDI